MKRNRKQKRDGEDFNIDSSVLLARPVIDQVLVYFFSLVFVAVLLYSYFTQYARTESARGEIAATSGFSTIVSDESAVVVQLFVKPGQSVRAGQPLAKLNRPRIVSEGNDTFTLSVSQMREGLRNFDLRIAENEHAESATRRQIAAAQNAAALSYSSAAERHALTQQRRSVAADRLSAIEGLANEGMVTGMAVDRARAQSLDVMQETVAAKLQMNEISRGRDERVAMLQAQMREFSQNSLALQAERLATQKQLDDLKAMQSFSVVAPADGIVASAPIRLGQRLEPGQRIFAISQPSAKLNAVLEVPSKAIGLIEQGQRVSLKYDAFPFRSYGLQYGTVIKVEEASIEGGATLGEQDAGADRRFVVEVRPDKDTILAYGNPRPLKVGMMLTADIEVERRSILQWWLSPLLSLKGRLR